MRVFDIYRLNIQAQFNLAQVQSQQLLAVSGSNTGSFNSMIASRMAVEAAATSASIASANWTGYANNQFDPPPWVETLNSSSIFGS